MIKKIIKKLQFNSDENIYDIIKKIKFLAIHTNNTPIAFITNRTGKCIGTLTLSDFYRLKNKKNVYYNLGLYFKVASTIDVRHHGRL